MSDGVSAGNRAAPKRSWQSADDVATGEGRVIGVERVANWAQETRRYRRTPGGWWWLALLGIPLLLAALSIGFGGSSTPSTTTSSTTTTSAGSTSTSSSSSSAGGSATSTSTPTAANGPVGTLASAPFAVRRQGGEVFVSAEVPDAAAKTTLVDEVKAALPGAAVDDSGIGVVSGASGPDAAALTGVLAAFKNAGDFGLSYDMKQLTYYGAAATDAVKSAADGAVSKAWSGVTADGKGLVVGQAVGQAVCDGLGSRIKVLLDGSKVTFATAGSTLSGASPTVLTNIATLVKPCPAAKLAIVGFTDSDGSESNNQKLSLRRADAVKTFLANAGIPAAGMTTEGKGESDPFVLNDSPANKALNRRVEITVN